MGSVYKSLRPLATNKSFSLLHSLAPIAVVDPNVVSNPYHPLNHTVLERLKAEEMRAPRLIIYAVATKKRVSKHSVVRSKAVRRVREAAYEALKERGYGKEGGLLKATENGMAYGKERLVGTLSFRVTGESVLTGWGDLKKEVGTAIDMFIALRQKGQGMQQKGAHRARGGYGAGWGRPGTAAEKVGEGSYQRRPPGAVGGGQSSYQRKPLGERYGNRWPKKVKGDGESSHQKSEGYGGRYGIAVEGGKGNLSQGKPPGEGHGGGRPGLGEARWQGLPQRTPPGGAVGEGRGRPRGGGGGGRPRVEEGGGRPRAVGEGKNSSQKGPPFSFGRGPKFT